MRRRQPRSTSTGSLFTYTTLFRSPGLCELLNHWNDALDFGAFPRLFRAGPGRLPADVNHRRTSFIHGEGRGRGGGWIVQMLAAIGQTVRRHIQHAPDLGRIGADDPLAHPERRPGQTNSITKPPPFGVLSIPPANQRAP